MEILIAVLSFLLGGVSVAYAIRSSRLSRLQAEILGKLDQSHVRLRKLQDATAELEVREKIGCIRGNAGRLQAAVELRRTAKTTTVREEAISSIQRDRELVVQDSRAVLPIIELAPESLQIEFKNAVLYAMEILSQTGQAEHLWQLRTAIAEYAHRIEVAAAARLHSLVEQSMALTAGHRGSAEVSSDLFSSVFQSSVRVIFDWERMASEKWPVRLEVFDQLDDISSWYLPWNVDHEGREVRFDHADAHPIQLSAVPAYLSGFDEARREKVNALARAMGDNSKSGHPNQIVAVTYALPSGRRLVLDGSHRTSGLMIARAPFKLLAFTVYGPLEGTIVPELRHWESVSHTATRSSRLLPP